MFTSQRDAWRVKCLCVNEVCMWQHWRARDASLGPSSRCPRHSVPAVKQTRVGENFNFAHRPRAVHLVWKRGFGGMSNDDIGLIEHPFKPRLL